MVEEVSSCCSGESDNVVKWFATPKQADNGKGFFATATTSKHQQKDDSFRGKQSTISDELREEVVFEIQNLLPICCMVHGSPRHPESNGGVESVNQTAQDKLQAWMIKHNSKQWSVGCHLVQWQNNTQFHHTVQNVLYILMFGQKPWIGILNLPLEQNVINNLHVEAQLIFVVDMDHVNEPIRDLASNNQDNENYNDNKELHSHFDDGNKIEPGSVSQEIHTIGTISAAAYKAMDGQQLIHPSKSTASIVPAFKVVAVKSGVCD